MAVSPFDELRQDDWDAVVAAHITGLPNGIAAALPTGSASRTPGPALNPPPRRRVGEQEHSRREREGPCGSIPSPPARSPPLRRSARDWSQ
ncbi:hypothetical protein [Streptacidiphilus neutrinimicus]|uniref:hypothetical protein n=1 Tax=Streptacidiphilus neutrinimicus TaxID=105420 RepID=UPI001F2FFFC9|nr:hypothetical protein [Streptacidiphilus neutrinimicus]